MFPEGSDLPNWKKMQMQDVDRAERLVVVPRPLSREMDAALFAAALYTITSIWRDEMDDLQRSSLANQIVREIERRGLVAAPPAQMEPAGWLIGGENEGRGQFFTTKWDVMEVAKARGLAIAPLYALPAHEDRQ